MAKKKKSKKDGKKLTTQQLIIIVIVVVVIIITVGWFFYRKQKEQEKQLEKENKKKRLTEVEARITELEKHKKEIEEIERQILIKARIIIGILLVVANILYKIYFINPLNLKDILTFNSAILLCYSFFAFITYGTPANLIANLKQRIANYLRSEHVDSLEELKQLIIERDALIVEIKSLDDNETKEPLN